MKIVIECLRDLRENLHLSQGKTAETIEKAQSCINNLLKVYQRFKDEENDCLKRK